ncbi:MAG: class I SAM-dependent methyltransferase [Paracoccaceae bacterium]|nr:class I SAM-dependent methyltransferase [Paracoccaceae bacterium]
MSDDPNLEAAYGLETPEDNRQLYRAWAETYDSGFAEDMGYVLALRVAEVFADAWVAGPVLDLGAGTGLCGEALVRLGVGPVDATDLSPEMLAVAARKGVYRALFTGNLLEHLPVEEGAYAGAVSSGTFTNGHVGPEALGEVLRILRPGGEAVLSVNAVHWQKKGFDAAFAALADQITGLTLTETPIYGPEATGEHAKDMALIVRFAKA